MPINFDHTGNLIVTNDGLLTYEMTGAIRLPRGTTAQRPASPVSGMIRYNSTLSTFEGYTTSWQDLLAGGGGGGASITVSDTAPSSPAGGDLWYKSNDPVGLYLWYVDVDSSQWILVAKSTLTLNQSDFNSAFDTRLALKYTTDLAEGTNLYFTNERVDDRVAALLTAGADITLTYNDVANTLTIANSFSAVQQGGGTDMSTDKVYIGWRTDGLGLQAQVTSTPIGTLVRNVGTPLGDNQKLTAPGSPPLFACRAWVNFNGTGTVAIRGSGNVTSITDNGTGLYTVNFTTSMPDANYAVNLSYSNEVNVQHGVGFIANLTASSVQVAHYNAANSANTVDKTTVCVSVFR